MSIGSATQKLGLANPRIIDATSFAQTVLRLQAGTPVYQQMLVHAQNSQTNPLSYFHGPCAGAEWGCGGGSDGDVGANTIIREVSPCDTKYARRNLSEAADPNYTLEAHRLQYSNQIYYVLNEPNAGSWYNLNPDPPGTSDNSVCKCWDPRLENGIKVIDNSVCIPVNDFWQPHGGTAESCGQPPGYRVYAKALAFVYLKIKRETEILGQNHLVIPPAPSSGNPIFGSGSYLEEFYNFVRDGVFYSSGCQENGIDPEDISVLNIHRYADDPAAYPNRTPLEAVTIDAGIIREAVDWYRTNYILTTSMPLNVLLSETGYYHPLDGTPIVWAGGWDGFRKGLSWWNSYLCWLTRVAAVECNLESGLDVHSCFQATEAPPYTTASDSAAGADTRKRNQCYLNVNNMTVQMLYLQPSIQIDGLIDGDQNPYLGTQVYRNSFLKYRNGTAFQNKTWRTTPFGACLTTWAQIGADPASPNSDLGLGWVLAPKLSTGLVATASVALPEGYSTVYFTVIKLHDSSNWLLDNRVNINWIRADGTNLEHGYIALNDFQDTQFFNGQLGYSAMVFPVVCYSHPDSLISVELSRITADIGLYLGRPIVLPGICSWFIEQ